MFAGAQLALTIIDLKTRKELSVVFSMVGVALATNLAIGFLIGIIVAGVFRREKISV